MAIVFEVFKGVFFLMSIIVGLFFLRGDYFMSETSFELYGTILMPIYIIMAGVMIGYIASVIWIIKDDIKEEAEKNKVYTKTFAIGTFIGVLSGIVYIFI